MPQAQPHHFEYCPKCGEPEPELMQDNAIRCEACGFELYFNPTSSAACLIFNKHNELLVIERAREPAKGKYGLPGGFVDFGESAEEAARRETKEEVNLDVESLEFLGTFPNRYTHKDVSYPVLDIYFIAKARTHESIGADGKEVSCIHFIDPSKVPEDQWAFDSLRAAIKKLLGTG